MIDWLRRSGWTPGDVLALVGLVVTVAIAAIGPLRRWVGRVVLAALMRAGRPERRYPRWFIDTWGQYGNPYLADTEDLDLSSTFVSLSFRAPHSEQGTRTVVTKVLADREQGNLIIEGALGSPGAGPTDIYDRPRSRHWVQRQEIWRQRSWRFGAAIATPTFQDLSSTRPHGVDELDRKWQARPQAIEECRCMCRSRHGSRRKYLAVPIGWARAYPA
jgi:hypothetical protein